jgi:hypothetical protein
MASTFNLANAAAAASAGDGTNKGLAAFISGGYLVLYDGTQPANADTALSSNNAYCSTAVLTYGTITDSNGALTIPITSGACTRSGTPTFYRAYTSGGSAAFDGSVAVSTGTASGSDLNFSNVSGGAFVSGGTISVTSFTVTIQAH